MEQRLNIKKLGTRLVAGLILSLPVFLGTIRVSWGKTAEEYRIQGLSDRQQEKYPEAIEQLTKAVALEPDNIAGRVILGWTQHRANQPEAATQTLVETFYRQPFNVPNLNALGIVHLVNDRLPEAVITHSWAIAIKPDNEIAHYNLSLAMERLGQYAWAVSNALEASKLEPTNPHPFIALSIAYWGAGDRPQALQAFQQALSLDGRYAEREFLNYLGEAGFSPPQIKASQEILQNLPKGN